MFSFLAGIGQLSQLAKLCQFLCFAVGWVRGRRLACKTSLQLSQRFWLSYSFTSHTIQNRSFRGCSSQPISWLVLRKQKSTRMWANAQRDGRPAKHRWRPLFNATKFGWRPLLEWANAQRDGRPAKHRWRPLFNATKFGWRPLLECRAVTLPRRESRWNLQGCLKLANTSQPLVGQSSPY